VASRFDKHPDFAAIARGFGLRGCELGNDENALETLRGILAEPGPCIINVPVHFAENVMPMVPPGAANRDMVGGELTHA
ncbi:MAG: acetolactate synthase large subunit, partial [FCB group bacterium]|jgi:acetolactate synthase-1/2/3 large subunit|nr:acetolactate synthase large subunit [FCB group bacterium]